MKINEVIRKYRKERRLTQEEMANYLGVTAPAVNKWESGSSYPDISLLAPIARLLEVSLDTLLSYREELTDIEVNHIVKKLSELAMKDYDAGYEEGMKYLKEYPNNENLIFQVVTILDGYHSLSGTEIDDSREKKMEMFFRRLLESESFQYRESVITLLFSKCLTKGKLDEAEEYLKMLPERKGNPNTLRAMLYKKQGKTEEAYTLYETQLMEAYNNVTWSLQGMFSLAIEEENIEFAEHLVEAHETVANALEMGDFTQLVSGLELACHQKNSQESLSILEKIVDNLDQISAFRYSKLFTHIKFREDTRSEFIPDMIQRGLENDEGLAFLRNDSKFKAILEKVKSK